MTRANTIADAHKFIAIDDGCWLWKGPWYWRYKPVKKPGYGVFYLGGKTVTAHRLMYEYFYGISPGDLEVCHTCDKTLCVRPSHLFLGTHAENMADMVRKGRAGRQPGEQHWCAKLTEQDVRAIRASPKTQTALAEEYGVTQCTINYILVRRTWKHVK